MIPSERREPRKTPELSYFEFKKMSSFPLHLKLRYDILLYFSPMKKPIQPSRTIQVATDSGSQTPKPIPVLAAHLCGDMTHNLLFTHGNFIKLTFEKLVSFVHIQICSF